MWDIRLGYHTHSRPEEPLHGCKAALIVVSPSDHDLGIGDIFLVVEVRYTDRGDCGDNSGTPSLTGRTGIRLDFGGCAIPSGYGRARCRAASVSTRRTISRANRSKSA